MRNNVRFGWLRFMYVYTFIGAGLTGAGMLVVPATMQALFKWPACDPIGYGVIGSVYLAFGLVSLLGIRDPVKFAPLLLIQFIYKFLYMAGVFAPWLVAGHLSYQGAVLTMIYLTYMVGDLIAIPFGWLFASRAPGRI